MQLTSIQRVALYNSTFPSYPCMWADKGWLMGVWVLGNLYKRRTAYYGAYPGNFLKRVLALFPDRTRTLHLFSGTVATAGLSDVAVDSRLTADTHPTVLADARRLPFTSNAFDFVLADPPYSALDAERYGTPMISRRHVMTEIATVVEPGGILAWLDTVRPMYRRQEWTQTGSVAVLVSTNTRTRCLSIFERPH